MNRRKEINLPEQVIKDLKIVAAFADMSPKKYMEELIMNDVRSKILKIKK